MELARVIGRAVATVKYPTLEGVKLLVLQGVNARDEPQGSRSLRPTRCRRGRATW